MADINEALLTDIAHKKDFLKSPTGDIQTISGLDNLKLALFHRLVTEKGTLVHRPLYGVGIKRYQNAPNMIAVQRQLALDIQEQFEEDDRVEKVLGVQLDADDYTPEKVKITVRVKVVGYGDQTLSFTPFGEGVI